VVVWVVVGEVVVGVVVDMELVILIYINPTSETNEIKYKILCNIFIFVVRIVNKLIKINIKNKIRLKSGIFTLFVFSIFSNKRYVNAIHKIKFPHKMIEFIKSIV
jgi:hypothetical protein